MYPRAIQDPNEIPSMFFGRKVPFMAPGGGEVSTGAKDAINAHLAERRHEEEEAAKAKEAKEKKKK